jgi:cytochrome c oxidase subunit 2
LIHFVTPRCIFSCVSVIAAVRQRTREDGWIVNLLGDRFSRTPAVRRHLSWSRRHRAMQIKCNRDVLRLLLAVFFPVSTLFAQTRDPAFSPTSIFSPTSTPARSIFGLSLFVLAVTAVIFAIVFSLLVYAVVKFRNRSNDDCREPPQVYGSNQVELAWTVIPVLIVVTLFMATARVTAEVQNASHPDTAVDVVAIGHQFWWEFRYPALKVVTANELHVPVSEPGHPTPTFLKLLSADTNHSFWVPRLAGKTDLIPNRVNGTWIDPHETGLYLGQCAQYCGTQHAKMLLRVYVQTRDEFDRWIQEQIQPARVTGAVSPGRKIFETTACINCHTVAGTVADGRFGPDLTHLMSRDTIASGAAPNTPANLRLWIRNPDALKPGSKMPAMGLSDQEVDAVTEYLQTLR